MKLLFKFLHVATSAVLLGGCAALWALALAAQSADAAALDGLRRASGALMSYVVLPTMFASMATGLLPIATRPSFFEEPWVWLKAILGLLMIAFILFRIRPGLGQGPFTEMHPGPGGAATLDAWAAAIRLEIVYAAACTAMALAAFALGAWRPKIRWPQAT